MNNIVWGNSGGDGAGFCSSWFETGGNMVVDAMLCRPDAVDKSVAEGIPVLTRSRRRPGLRYRGRPQYPSVPGNVELDQHPLFG